MKKAIYFLFLLLAITSCKDEETAFKPTVGTDAFTFKAVPGGAVMRFAFPADNDLMGLNIRYKDYAGHEILRSASAQSDSILLEGFNQAQQNVQAEVRLVKRNGDESNPIPVTFSTEDSAPYAFFDHVQVKSGWNGFSVLTDNTSNASGLAHIYYVGTDPLSGKPDSILVKTINITEGKDTLNFHLKQLKDLNTIIIRTEDYRGYMVREEKWDNIAAYNTVRLDPAKFDFYFDKSVEDEQCLLGEKYLFDGELKGETFFKHFEKYSYSGANYYNMFLAGPEALDDPMYIDMHKDYLTSEVRLYTALNVRKYNWAYSGGTYYTLFRNNYYVDKVPCYVELYAAKDDKGPAGDWDKKDWKLVAKVNQDPDLDDSYRWNAKAWGNNTQIKSYEDALKADPVYMPLTLQSDDQGDGYRYLKIVVHKTFNYNDGYPFGPSLNAAKYFVLQELEVWTKKED